MAKRKIIDADKVLEEEGFEMPDYDEEGIKKTGAMFELPKLKSLVEMEQETNRFLEEQLKKAK
jgi:hypothetical protein